MIERFLMMLIFLCGAEFACGIGIGVAVFVLVWIFEKVCKK